MDFPVADYWTYVCIVLCRAQFYCEVV